MFKKFCFATILSLVLLAGFSQLTMANGANCHAYANSVAPAGTAAWLDAYEMCICRTQGCL